MFLHCILQNIKQRSNQTLRSWVYQCESILAQRSRRFQQLFTFYHRVYGTNGLRLLLRSYHKQFEPPLRCFVLSAAGTFGVTITDVGGTGYNWMHERLSLSNFNACRRDLEFIDSLPYNQLCPLCKEKQMKYCYCLLGNKKCRSPGGQESIRNCHKPMGLEATADGKVMIEASDESTWEPYFCKDEFSIWRREERTAMYAYKVYARFDDVTAADLLHVQTDVEYRRQWDETAVRLEIIEEDPQIGSNSHLIYWEMQWPKFFSNRDYVYCRRFVTDDKRKVMMVCSRGTKHKNYPPFSSKVRVNDYWSLMVIKPYRSFQEPGVHYILTYYDDPGLPIPQNIKSWVTQKQMPDFLRKMYTATKQYSCKRAIEMKQVQMQMHLKNFNIMDNEYTANVDRASWLRRMWTQRERGK